ncbi:hypothetical protein ACFC0M_35355 [Streptomyces sp. NPDC056149]|uniref:hypothetical protein n=1 Tax=Streptomyces sp. NPDC056149 TaxID=3345728 RepID=UPI0035D96F64
MPSTDPTPPPALSDEGPAATGPTAGPPHADCVECGRPTEYPASTPGIVHCPVCAWQEAQRTACSG